MIRRYHVIYDSDDETFIVHREASVIPDMDFSMNKSVLHVLYPEDIKNMVIINTVEDNMKAFTKRDVKGEKAERKIYAKLLYRMNAGFMWLIKNNQMKNCEVLVASDLIEIPKDITYLKKKVFLTADIFFVNGIPFFMSLRRKIDFRGMSHLKRRTAEIIFDAFKAIFRLYLQQSFHIQTVHSDA